MRYHVLVHVPRTYVVTGYVLVLRTRAATYSYLILGVGVSAEDELDAEAEAAAETHGALAAGVDAGRRAPRRRHNDETRL